MCLQEPAKLQFAVGAHHRVRIDRKIDCELAHSGELVARTQRSGRNSPPHLVDKLAIDRNTAMQIDRELKRRLVIPAHAYQCTIVLVQYVKRKVWACKMASWDAAKSLSTFTRLAL